MTAVKKLKNVVIPVVRANAGLIGFLVLICVEFARCIYKIVVSVDAGIENQERVPPTASPIDSVPPTVVTNHEADKDVQSESAVSHELLHSGVIRDASTKIIQLSLYGGHNPRIERSLRIPIEKLEFQRINWRFERIALLAYTPEIAQRAGLPFTFEGAKKYSLPDFNDKAHASRRFAEVSSFEVPPAFKPQKVSSLVDTHDANSSTSPGSLTEATGCVTSANSVVVTPEGKASYQSFAVVLKTLTGDVSFQGVDLEEQFKKYHFSIKDHVYIKKASSKFNFTEPGGKTKQRTKNTFEITILKKAQI